MNILQLKNKAYQYGFNNGHGLACHNKPRIGDKKDINTYTMEDYK